MKKLFCQPLMITVFLFALAMPGWGADEPTRVALLAQNDGTEITDLFIPYSLLSAADVDVSILATDPGPVNLMNGMELLDLQTIGEVSPQNFDLVIVPAVHNEDQPRLLSWLGAIYSNGGTVASICDGVEVLAAAGLLDGRQATGHFYSAGNRQRDYPNVHWVKNRRYVEDTRVFTTAGISASAPATIRLLQKFVSAESAMAVAAAYNIDTTNSSAHNSQAFSVRLGEISVGVKNLLLGLRKRQYNLQTGNGVDEYLLGLTADALARTYRVALAIDTPDNTVRTKNGLRIRGQKTFHDPDWTFGMGTNLHTGDNTGKVLQLGNPSTLLPALFQHIQSEFGTGTADFVGLQLEFPDRGAAFYR